MRRAARLAAKANCMDMVRVDIFLLCLGGFSSDEATPSPPNADRDQWYFTDREITLLLVGRANRVPYKILAERLGRSKRSLAVKYHHLTHPTRPCDVRASASLLPGASADSVSRDETDD